MSIRTLLIACCGLLIPGSASLNAQCTAETETGRRIVRGYAAHDVTTGPDGRLVLTENQVRPLADPGDSSVCQRLLNVWWAQWRTPDEAKPDWAWTYYQVGTCTTSWRTGPRRRSARTLMERSGFPSAGARFSSSIATSGCCGRLQAE